MEEVDKVVKRRSRYRDDADEGRWQKNSLPYILRRKGKGGVSSQRYKDDGANKDSH